MKCRNPECNADVNPTALFCGKCGTPVLANCTECGTPIPAKKTVKCCPKCGTMLSAMKKSPAGFKPEPRSAPFPVPDSPPVSGSTKIINCTNCGALIPDKRNVKCCPKCGTMLSAMKKPEGSKPKPDPASGYVVPPASSSPLVTHCTNCGTPMPDRKNVKCCPKCGTMVSDMLKTKPTASEKPSTPVSAKLSFCTECGAPISSQEFLKWCPSCGAELFKAPPKPTPAPTPAPVPEPTESSASHEPPHPVTKDPFKKVLIIALVIGLCLLWSGLGGKLIMGRCRTELNNVLRNQGLDILDYAVGGVVEDLAISVIHNDVNEFIAAFNKIVSAAGSMMGAPSEVFALAGGMVTAQIRDQFPDFRNQMVDSVTPPAWIVLVFASYNRIFLILGALITVISAILWFIVQKGKLSDIREQKMIPAIAVGAVWCVAVTVITIIGMTIKL